MSDAQQLQEALEVTLDVYAGISEPSLSDAEAKVRAAARSYLAVLEPSERLVGIVAASMVGWGVPMSVAEAGARFVLGEMGAITDTGPEGT